jgi:NADH-quinone oxidoreductase subunit N
MIPADAYIRILPEIVLSVFGIIVMMLDPLLADHDNRKSLGILAAFGFVAALAATVYQTTLGPAIDPAGPATWWRMVRVDNFSIFFHVVVILVGLAVTLMSFEYLETQQIRHGEYYALMLFATVGMGLMSSAMELVLIFVALEISSISTYVLAGFRRRAAESAEYSLKYFLLGSFATAFFLYGIAMMFGATRSTNIVDIAAALHTGASPLVYLAIALMVVGLGFKVAAAPFQIWTPDVYEGAPAPVVAMMSTGPKAAAFAVLLRVLFGTGAPGWFWIIWVSAALSMTLGNLGALVQQNVKRMLAYSSIAHAGYLLVAFAATRDMNLGISAAMFYAASYAAMNVGAFAIVSHFANAGEKYVLVDDYAGLGRRSPLLAAMLTLFLLSLIGIPMTGGFFAKFYVFSAALKSNLIGLTIIGVINSAVGAYYYLRLIVLMYMREERVEVAVQPVSFGLGAALALTSVATIYLGVLPGHVLNYALASAKMLLPW